MLGRNYGAVSRTAPVLLSFMAQFSQALKSRATSQGLWGYLACSATSSQEP